MPTHPRGAIVLAAYSPDRELFRRQLRSLQEQTVTEWECIISVDGERRPVEALVAEIVGTDERFRVVGDDTRRGFYGNFEAGLRAVHPDAAWIALCDQDDRWDADKLERTLPHLADVSMVSGQARLLRYPAEEVVGVTDRRDTGPLLTVLNNQFTGSLSVFAPELLATALPFPVASTRAAAHDHWLAVVAADYRGTRVIPDVVQDYVQHDANVFGDPSRMGGWDIAASVRNISAMARRYEGSTGLPALLRMTFWAYVGWRQLMVDTLAARRPHVSAAAEQRMRIFGNRRRWRAVARLLRSAVASGLVPPRFAVEYTASWFAGWLVGGRRLVARAIVTQPLGSARR